MFDSRLAQNTTARASSSPKQN